MENSKIVFIFAAQKVTIMQLDYKKIYEIEHIQNGLSYKQIRDKYKISRGTWDYYIRQKLKFKADLRKYRANDNFFEVINSEEKAYLLGFLYADGYLSSDGRMGCRLKIDDVEIIKLIQKYICPNSPIEYGNNQNFKRRPQCSIRWKSKKMYQKLLNLDFCIDKTHTNSNVLTYIPEPYKKDFIRGFLDGDGCITYNSYRNSNWKKISLCWSNGSSKILEDIFNYFKDVEGGVLKYHNTYYTLRYDKIKSVQKILSFIYDNATLYLKRKKIIADNILNYYSNTVLTRHITKG